MLDQCVTAGVRPASPPVHQNALQPVTWPLSRAERERWIVEHRPLVRMIAYRIARRFPSQVDAEELVSVGIVGLIEAVDRFEPSRGVPFRAFADIRIRGAIVDAIRGGDWLPRVVRQKYALIDATRRALRQRLGREADRAEMASALSMSPEAYDDLVGGAVIRKVISLDAVASPNSNHTVAEVVADDQDLAVDRWIESEQREELDLAIGRLPANERQVIVLYYQEGMKYNEIGQVLGVCESRVSQLRGKAVRRIQKSVGVAIAC